MSDDRRRRKENLLNTILRPASQPPAYARGPVVVQSLDDANLAKQLGRQTTGNAGAVFQQGLAFANNTPQPLDEVARVESEDGSARMWNVTIGSLTALQVGLTDTSPPLPANAVMPKGWFQEATGFTKAVMRWGRAGTFQVVEFDWRLGQQLSVYAEFVSIACKFDGYFVPAGSTLQPKAWIAEARGGGGPPSLPVTWTYPRVITVAQGAVSASLPVPLFARRFGHTWTTAGQFLANFQHTVEFICNAPAISARVEFGSAGATRPAVNVVDVPAPAQLFRMGNQAGVGVSMDFLAWFELAL